jgi:glycosyltransferase involved in cell wall biosynthesis
VREVLELERQGLRPLIFSIRDTRDEVPRNFPDELYERVIFLPPEKELVEEVKVLKAAEKLPQEIVLTLREWKNRDNTSDKARVYEAAWIGLKMLEAGVRHSHSHFAGIGARSGWWLRKFYGFSYSFTGHANDLFCKTDLKLTLDDLMRDASLVVTVSDYTVANLQQRFPHAAQKVKRVYNGLDLAPFEIAGERRDLVKVWNGEEAPLILSVGRLIEKKGYDDLVRACAGLKERGVENFRCIIVGDGPMEDELRELISELGVVDQVELAGPKSQAEIIDYLERTALFALPCVTEKDGGKDNLPTVLMEAMAARVACASTVLAGVPEMVIDGETGHLVPEREPEQFAGILTQMLNDPERTNAMAEAGHAHAKEHFAKEVTAKQLRRLLVARGRTRFDFGLMVKDAGLVGSYLGQWVRRITGKF